MGGNYLTPRPPLQHGEGERASPALVSLAQQSRGGFQFIAILAVLLLGVWLFIHQLDHTTLWVDEGWTVSATNGPGLDGVTRRVAEDVHPPLYFYALYLWRQVTGDSVFEMRYFTALTALVTVALVYRLGKALFGAQAGLLAAGLFVLHDLVIVLSQEVRQYPQQQLFAALTLWMYWRFWQKPTLRRGLGFALSGAALIWTQYWGAFLLLAIALHSLLTRRRRWQALKPFVLANGLILASFIPWLPVLYQQVTQDIPGGLGHALPNSRIGYETLAYQLLGTPQWFWGMLIAVGMVGLGVAWPGRFRLIAASSLVALAALVPVGLSIGINIFYAILSFRVLSVTIPALVALAAYALTQFRRYERLVIVTFIVAHSLTTTSARPPLRLPWPEIATFVAERSASGDRVLIESNFDAYALLYYLEEAGAKAPVLTTELERREDPADFAGYLRDSLDETAGVWIIKQDFPYYDLRSELYPLGWVATASLVWQPNPNWHVELWRLDRPPSDDSRMVFDGSLRLERAAVSPGNDWVTVNLLWSPLEKPARNYTVSAFLLDQSGRLVSQHDSYPFENRSPTLDWQAGGLYYDGHVLSTEKLPPGQYQVGLKVYYFTDPNFTQLQIAPASDCSANPACEYIIVATVDLP